MRTFSTLLLAVCGAAALAAHAPAQQTTAADKASYERFLKSCAPQIAAMRKEMAAHGETLIEAQFRDYFEVIPAQMRDLAREEGMSLADVLRESISRMRQAMDDPASTDPSDKVVGPTMICYLEMLVAGEDAHPTPAAAPRPEEGIAPPTRADLGVEGFRTHCADEGRKVGAALGWDFVTPQADGIAPMDEVYTRFSEDPESRRTAKAQFHDAMAAGTEALYRARLGLAACAIHFLESAEIGIPLSVMARQWREERVNVYALDQNAAEAAPPPPPAPAPRPAPRPAPAPAPAPAPPVSTAQVVADAGGCLTIDWRGASQGAPAILSNLCNHSLNVAVCIKQPTPGTASEHVACEQSRFTSYFIGARRSVTVPATHGPGVTSRVCTHPQFPAMWWENGVSVGNCR